MEMHSTILIKDLCISQPWPEPNPQPATWTEIEKKTFLLVIGRNGERRPKSQLMFWPRVGSFNALMAYLSIKISATNVALSLC